MADKALEDYLDDVLNDRIPVIPKLADLPSLWREAPAEASDSSHSGDPDRLTWLAMYIDMADTKPWARAGLRGLLQEVLENGEPVPDLLSCWVHHQYAQARIHRWTGMDGVRTAEGGEGVTGAMIRARIWVDGRLAGGLQALLGAPMAAYSGCGERDGGFEISAITVSYSPPPDARYRLRRIITMMIKHAARDRRAAQGENAPPSDPQAEDHAEADG